MEVSHAVSRLRRGVAMICAVHALLGAAIGSVIEDKGLAFLAGMVSHIPADLAPHRDYSLAVEVPMVIGALAVIGVARGWKSPTFLGALGAALPDLENAFESHGESNENRTIFPTHRASFHGARAKSIWPQVVLGGTCALIAFAKRQPKP